MLKQHAPWWLKIGAKIILSHLPIPYRFWQKLGLFRHGHMDVVTYAIDVFELHIERGKLRGALEGKTVLELGPGDSIATALIAAAHGAQAILLDTGAFSAKDLAFYQSLSEKLRERDLRPPELTGCTTVKDVLIACRALYLTEGLASFIQIPDQSVDFIFSQAVLEHIRKKDFAETLRQCRRVLRSTGVCSHRVDLRDHLSGNLNNLRFSTRIWESQFFARSGFYTNRIQFRSMLQLFSQAGFCVQATGIARWPALPTPRNKLSSEFREILDDELCVHGFDVLLSPN